MLSDISASMQDYLEVILELGDGDGLIRVTDIAKKLGVAKASVNQTINKLKNMGLVSHEVYGPVKLTIKGKEVANKVRLRHRKLYDFLTNVLGVESMIAEKDACLMEHVISEQTLEKLTYFLDNRFSK